MEKNRAPYGLDIIQSCLSCPVHEGALLCQLSPEALAELDSIRQTSSYPAGALLFVEGQPCRGLFVLCSGRVKLTASSPQGRSVIIRIATSGEVLGLSAVIANAGYVASAETLEPTQASFFARADFLRFLENHGEVSVRVAEHLSMELRRAYHQVAQMVLSPNVRARLAGLLLDEIQRNGQVPAKGMRFQLRLTHQEIAEIIGSSRETITRLLSEFRNEGLIQSKGASITILDPDRMKSLLS